ncbi:hypothetical protein [Emticicia agri]|uniref:DUF3828 domain-containing protein n=1 Tax=Emticicia agri TaxID=2492393 RepID=A0A4Q5M2F7_9BACT|nr:hypothetical protein [Emticicia agri]RYU96209.1 hypothetical protein EWM59_08340 [Emticicia agri]
MLAKEYRLKHLINPSLKIWGIYCFVAFAIPLHAQQTPQQRLGKFFSWLGKPAQVPDENECFEGEGMDITKINPKCLQNYLSVIEKTGLFSSIYLRNLKNEFKVKQSVVAKKEIAERLDYDRYLLSQDPPTIAQLLYALKNSSSTKIDKTKATVTVNIKKPYIHTLIYKFDLEENIWKISSIESKE